MNTLPEALPQMEYPDNTFNLLDYVIVSMIYDRFKTIIYIYK